MKKLTTILTILTLAVGCSKSRTPNFSGPPIAPADRPLTMEEFYALDFTARMEKDAWYSDFNLSITAPTLLETDPLATFTFMDSNTGSQGAFESIGAEYDDATGLLTATVMMDGGVSLTFTGKLAMSFEYLEDRPEIQGVRTTQAPNYVLVSDVIVVDGTWVGVGVTPNEGSWKAFGESLGLEATGDTCDPFVLVRCIIQDGEIVFHETTEVYE